MFTNPWKSSGITADELVEANVQVELHWIPWVFVVNEYGADFMPNHWYPTMKNPDVHSIQTTVWLLA